jgi:hypothetical protein
LSKLLSSLLSSPLSAPLAALLSRLRLTHCGRAVVGAAVAAVSIAVVRLRRRQ